MAKLSHRFGEEVTFSRCTIPSIGLKEVILFLEMK
ncbi:MAG: hypothetical protein KTR26_16615 [Flammeovirgaceae bacterium]|nr:hypothetical protein [Flammeovirgaceae bacterium]